MAKRSVLLAEDHPLMVEAVKLALGRSADFEIIGITQSGSEVVALATRLQPDLVLLDLALPQVDGLEVLRSLRRSGSDTAVIIFSAHDDADLVDNALREGAAGFISKRINADDLPAALRQILDPTLFRPLAVTTDGSATDHPRLSSRELEVLHALLDGLSNKAISERLSVTEQTVKALLTSLYRKLGVSSRTEAVAAAYGRGLQNSSPAEPAAGRLAGS
jgi:two-component system, NarL family, nitrate/nitrite response regulator NarL